MRSTGEPLTDADDDIVYSVIIAMYNAEATIGEQLDALASQRCPVPWEVIVANNRSTDGSEAVATDHGRALPRFQLVAAHQRQGRSYARNTGAKHARGRFLIFVDADDIVAPGWLAAIHAAAEQGAVLMGGALDNVTLRDDSPLRPAVDHLTWAPTVLDFLPYALGCNHAVERQVFVELGGWDERFRRGEDVAFSWNAQVNGHDLTFVADALLYYRLRSTLLGMIKQQFGNGFVVPQLLREYREHGARREPLRRAALRIATLLMTLPAALINAERRWWWLRSAALQAGRLVGSVRWRTFCP